MKQDTAIVHLGREAASVAHTMNPPLVRASTVVSDSLDAFKKAYANKVFDSPRYGRSGMSMTFELQCLSCGLSNMLSQRQTRLRERRASTT